VAALLGRTQHFLGWLDEANARFREALELISANGIGGYVLADTLEWQAALLSSMGLASTPRDYLVPPTRSEELAAACVGRPTRQAISRM
jgi:hypothetical protein